MPSFSSWHFAIMFCFNALEMALLPMEVLVMPTLFWLPAVFCASQEYCLTTSMRDWRDNGEAGWSGHPNSASVWITTGSASARRNIRVPIHRWSRFPAQCPSLGGLSLARSSRYYIPSAFDERQPADVSWARSFQAEFVELLRMWAFAVSTRSDQPIAS
jgi:hypothetical protein